MGAVVAMDILESLPIDIGVEQMVGQEAMAGVEGMEAMPVMGAMEVTSLSIFKPMIWIWQ